MRSRPLREVRLRSRRRPAAFLLAGGVAFAFGAGVIEPAWLALPLVGVVAVVLAGWFRRAVRAAASERDAQTCQAHDAQAERRVLAARLEVARELHDALAHRLVEINVLAGITSHLGDRDPRHALQDIKRVSAEALQDLRNTLSVVRKPGEGAPMRTRPTAELP